MPRTFLILHGWTNRRPSGHWQFELAKDLKALGEDVIYPQLPNTDTPDKSEWLATLTEIWNKIPAGNEKIVIAHSLGTSLWLHAVAESNLYADRVLLVAPAGPSFLATEPLPGFNPLPDGIDGSNWRLVCSDADPVCIEGAGEYFGAKYGCDVDLIVGARHFAQSDGYGHWPSVLDWTLDPEVRMVSNNNSDGT